MGNLVGIKVSLSFMEVLSSFSITCPGVRSYLDRGSSFGGIPGVNFPLKEGFGRPLPWRVSFIHNPFIFNKSLLYSYISMRKRFIPVHSGDLGFLFAPRTAISLLRTNSNVRTNGKSSYIERTRMSILSNCLYSPIWKVQGVLFTGKRSVKVN